MTGSAPAKKKGIHTCLDTNGFVRRYDPVIDELLEVTDLVMLDLKQMNDEIHQNLVEFQTTARWSSPNIWRTKM
ncbi:pyruvate formate lyase-activating enzyme 1 [Escherichia coli]|uniref:Pyruvate formate lyase-activating enzyme 1 n=1 Tax=Escherichia coli TaxID=562 RepID=A0A376VNS5_ECOLX|nr:pyruvate formate lyase-activating enzyme 1 [Escherichia coli]